MLFREVFNSEILVKDLVNKLQNYSTNEKKGQFSDDSNLTGMISLINMLIQNNQAILTEQEYSQLVQHILGSLLFTFNLRPINQHITKEVSLIQYEKPFLNKCHSGYSRTAAYTLLSTICNYHP